MNEITTTTDLQRITTGLEIFEQRKASLVDLVESAKPLKVKDADDKEGYKAVREKAIEIRNAEIAIEKEGKAMRDMITPISKHISTKEKELLKITEDEKNRLVAEREWFESEQERIKESKRQAERKLVQCRIDALEAVGVAIDFAVVIGMSEEHFNLKLQQATTEWEAEQVRIKAETERIEAEKKAEAERIEQQRKEQEAERLRLEAQAKEQREAQAKIEADRKAIEDERGRIEKEKQAKIEAEQRAQELEREKKAAAEKALKDAEEKRIMYEMAVVEAKRLTEEKESRRVARMPDKKKLEQFARDISGIVSPELKSPEADHILSNAIKKLSQVQMYITQEIENL